MKSADNCTATLSADENIGAGEGATQYMIICPGNEAGDATSCASVDLGDPVDGVLAMLTPQTIFLEFSFTKMVLVVLV